MGARAFPGADDGGGGWVEEMVRPGVEKAVGWSSLEGLPQREPIWFCFWLEGVCWGRTIEIGIQGCRDVCRYSEIYSTGEKRSN